MVMYTTVVDVESEVRAEVSFDNDTIPTLQSVNEWIRQASSEVDLRTDSLYSSSLNSSIFLDSDGSGNLILPETPIISISELKYNRASIGQSSDWVTLTEGDSADFYVYKDTGSVQFIQGVNGNNVFPSRGARKFCVTYTSGYKTPPAFIKRLVTLMVAKRVINSLVMSQANTEGGSVQVGTIKVSDPSNYSLNSVKSMNAEIQELFKNLGLEFKVFHVGKVY